MENNQQKNNHYSMLSALIRLIAQGFGSGLSPFAPGTVGTLFAWLSYVVLTTRWPDTFTPLVWAWVIGIGFLAGLWICDRAGKDLGVADHKSIVWDEIIAFWWVLLLITPASFTIQALAFLLFRIFDILKPAPIKQFDQRYKNGFGVMLDDLLAAFYTLLLLAVYFSLNEALR